MTKKEKKLSGVEFWQSHTHLPQVDGLDFVQVEELLGCPQVHGGEVTGQHDVTQLAALDGRDTAVAQLAVHDVRDTWRSQNGSSSYTIHFIITECILQLYILWIIL